MGDPASNLLEFLCLSASSVQREEGAGVCASPCWSPVLAHSASIQAGPCAEMGAGDVFQGDIVSLWGLQTHRGQQGNRNQGAHVLCLHPRLVSHMVPLLVRVVWLPLETPCTVGGCIWIHIIPLLDCFKGQLLPGSSPNATSSRKTSRATLALERSALALGSLLKVAMCLRPTLAG